MGIKGFDHITVQTANSEAKFDFYKKLGFGVLFEEELQEGELDKGAITCGDNKINFRERGELGGARPHLCVVWDGGIDNLVELVKDSGLEIRMGPVPRLGGLGGGLTRGVSVYLRDPDQLTLEFISYDPEDIARYPGQTAEDRFRAERAVAKKKAET